MKFMKFQKNFSDIVGWTYTDSSPKIALSNIDQGENVQFSLFEDENKEKSRKMDQAVDAIREKFGNGMIQRGVTLNTNSRVEKRYLGDSDDKSRIFDLDGTLIDTEKYYRIFWKDDGGFWL